MKVGRFLFVSVNNQLISTKHISTLWNKCDDVFCPLTGQTRWRSRRLRRRRRQRKGSMKWRMRSPLLKGYESQAFDGCCYFSLWQLSLSWLFLFLCGAFAWSKFGIHAALGCADRHFYFHFLHCPRYLYRRICNCVLIIFVYMLSMVNGFK